MRGSRWSARYEIRVDGVLDDQWANWFGGLQLSNGGTQTIIVGLLPDQSALHGVLAKIRDLGLCLTLICPLDADDAGDRPQIWHLIEIGSCHHRHTGSIIRSSPGRWMLSTGPRGAWPHPVTGGHPFAGDRHLFLAKRRRVCRVRPGERVTVARAEAPSGTGGALG